MVFQAALLESIPQSKYLSAENYIQYRAIMRIFYLEHQKMHYQLDKENLLSRLHEDPVFTQYSAEQLTLDLDQLVNWKNLTPIQDPHKVYTVADFKNKQFQYMMSQAALEIERMTIILENLNTRVTGLSSSAFRRIHGAMCNIDHLGDMSLKEVGAWWQDLQEDFNHLSQKHQDYLREFYDPSAEKHMKSSAFISHKQNLIRYLEDFIQDLQSSSTQIGAQLEALSPEQTEHILSLVHRSELEVPRPQSELTLNWEANLRTQTMGVWQSLIHWFVGENSTANQVMEVTNEVIRRVVQNAALLVQMQNMGVSKKAEIRHLLSLFVQCETLDEAHKLSSQVFGVQEARHFTVNTPRTTDRIDSSTYDEPPMDYTLQPRIRTYKPRIDKSGFSNKTVQKEKQRQAILEEQYRLHRLVTDYIQNGILDFRAITRPLTPDVRNVFLSWISMANLSLDKHGRTEYGQIFSLQRRGEDTCQLVCTDGVLIMPDYILIFQEEAHV
jgi:uncharacterized protein (TIGR02677 family)